VLYHLYEFGQAAMSPARAAASSTKLLFRNPFNPLSYTGLGRSAAAAMEVMERTTRRYPKPSFGLHETIVNGRRIAVYEEIVWQKPFCRLIHFAKDFGQSEEASQPRLLIVAPLSGHFATLLRGTVQAMLPFADVYVTDWADARMVPKAKGRFDLDDYIDYVIAMVELFQGDVHLMGVCQPAVPVISAIALMEGDGHPTPPRSLILKGGPIDTRRNPTAVNRLAEKRGTEWFERTVIAPVPWPNPGQGRLVYPGFLQLTGFMAMNFDRHLNAHKDLFFNLVEGDGDSVDKHKEFYDEYMAVMDLTAEYYLQTVDQVFVKHQLAKGEMRHRGQRIDLSKIRRVALMTVEGEKDDITGLGQCEAAHGLCTALPRSMRRHHVQPGAGHYGIFNGSRFRQEIVPRIAAFMSEHDVRGGGLRRLMGKLSGERAIAPAPALLIAASGLAFGEGNGAAANLMPLQEKLASAPGLTLAGEIGETARVKPL
jgi:poly(3-hydroxybutyrate) depolymerase